MAFEYGDGVGLELQNPKIWVLQLPLEMLLELLKFGHIIMPSSRFSFCKMLTNLSSTFELPPEFTSKHRKILPSIAKLKIASGATWRVLVEQLEEESYYLTLGWRDFSQDMDLQIDDILVFTCKRNGTFRVCAYGANALRKDSNFLTFENLPQPNPNPNTNPNPTPPNLRFQVTLTKTYFYTLYVPKEFAEEWGLIGKKSVRLEYGGRRNSCNIATVKVACKLWRGRDMVYLAKGWSRFRKANGIVMGRDYEVEFVHSEDLIRINPLN